MNDETAPILITVDTPRLQNLIKAVVGSTRDRCHPSLENWVHVDNLLGEILAWQGDQEDLPNLGRRSWGLLELEQPLGTKKSYWWAVIDHILNMAKLAIVCLQPFNTWHVEELTKLLQAQKLALHHFEVLSGLPGGPLEKPNNGAKSIFIEVLLADGEDPK